MKKIPKKQSLVFFLLFVLGVLITSNYGQAICGSDFCYSLGQVLGIGSIVFGIPTILILVINSSILKSWYKFLAGYIPIAVLLIMSFSPQGNIVDPSRETVAMVLAGILLVASLVLIALQHRKIKSLPTKKQE